MIDTQKKSEQGEIDLYNDINNTPGNTTNATTKHLWSLGYRKRSSSVDAQDEPTKRCVYVLVDEAGGVDLKLRIPSGDSEGSMLQRGYVKYVAVREVE
jgi:hypothetical protein